MSNEVPGMVSRGCSQSRHSFAPATLSARWEARTLRIYGPCTELPDTPPIWRCSTPDRFLPRPSRRRNRTDGWVWSLPGS